MEKKRFKVALALKKSIAKSIFCEEDLNFLQSFAEINPVDGLPDEVTHPYMEKILHDADACVTCWGTPQFTGELLASAKKLRLITHAAGSIKSLVPECFWETGCRITSNGPIIAEDVAQTVLAFILFSLRGFWTFAKDTRDGNWSGGEASLFTTRRLNGLTVGIIGASNVGREVIKILKPFGCEIKIYDPYLSPIEEKELGVEAVALNDLISSSDVLSLHAPPTEGCRHMINRETAALIKDGALFINTARGMLVDEPAFIDELKKNRFFACIDVTDPEPPAKDHPFRTLGNVILTPHIAGGHTVNGRLMLGRNAISEIYNYLHKGQLKFEVRREMVGNMA